MFLSLVLAVTMLCIGSGSSAPFVAGQQNKVDAEGNPNHLNGAPLEQRNRLIKVTPFLTTTTFFSTFFSTSPNTHIPLTPVAAPTIAPIQASSFLPETSEMVPQSQNTLSLLSRSTDSSTEAITVAFPAVTTIEPLMTTSALTSSSLPNSEKLTTTSTSPTSITVSGLKAPITITTSSEPQNPPALLSANGGIDPPVSSSSTVTITIAFNNQNPDPAKFGIGPPPPGFKAPINQEPLKNTDLNSAPF